jgi:formiminoglutamase
MTPAERPHWLVVERGDAPLIVSVPHAGTEIPPEIEAELAASWLGRKDADWWVDHLYDFVGELGATTVRTRVSRTVIDVNRDPTGVSLYPGQATTELCPSTTFDGEPLYASGEAPTDAAIAARRARYFDPYHDALGAEIERLRAAHGRVVLYDAHSIRSAIPRLFEGQLPNFNIGDNSGASCHADLTAAVEAACDAFGGTRVTNGRFKGGYITRHYGAPATGIHAIQMELACRGYMAESDDSPTPDTWPSPFDPVFAAPMSTILAGVLQACLDFARSRP